MFDNYKICIKRGAMLLIVCLLSACASTITVTGKTPSPLVNKLPLNARLIYNDEFQRYKYQEEEKGRGLRSIAFGQAQVSLFDNIFGNLFTLVEPKIIEKSSVEKSDVDEGALDSNADEVKPKELKIIETETFTQNVDLNIKPTLLDFQYSAPLESRQNTYEIWLKYRLQVTGVNDQEVADFVIKGYGKTPTALLKSADAAFDSATNIALRDAGAQLAIGFVNQPLIKDYLKTRGVKQNLLTDTPLDNNVNEFEVDTKSDLKTLEKADK